MQLRVELAKQQIHEVPLDSLVADSQGAIGYMIQRDLREELERRGLRAEIATIVTEVEVDPDDARSPSPPSRSASSTAPTRPSACSAERGWDMVEDSHRGWRRVVPSPAPRAIAPCVAVSPPTPPFDQRCPASNTFPGVKSPLTLVH